MTSCQDILYYLKWDMQEKEIDQKQKRNLLSKVFNLFEIFEITEQEFLLDCLFSARTFIYWKYLFEKGKTKIFLSRHILSLTPYPRPVYMIKEALWVWWDWDTVSSVIEEYLKAPLEEFKCLRCFDNLDIWERNIFLKLKLIFLISMF